jgi:predicted  nucleic acid-binding Zn-ribbon protein
MPEEKTIKERLDAIESVVSELIDRIEKLTKEPQGPAPAKVKK